MKDKIFFYYEIQLKLKMKISRNDSELSIFAVTIYGEARGESDEGKLWVAWVIKNRALKNKPYWGGNSIKNVCLHELQFHCWSGKQDFIINDLATFEKILVLAENVIKSNQDPTDGCDHFLNPKKLSSTPLWVNNLRLVKAIGNHNFYKENI